MSQNYIRQGFEGRHKRFLHTLEMALDKSHKNVDRFDNCQKCCQVEFTTDITEMFWQMTEICEKEYIDRLLSNHAIIIMITFINGDPFTNIYKYSIISKINNTYNKINSA